MYQQQQPYQQPYQQQPQRSGIPKVIGILMIIFASLGLLSGLIGLVTNGSGTRSLDSFPEYKRFMTMSLVMTIVGLGISALHLAAGLSAVRYKQSAPKLAMAYGAIAIVTTLAWTVVVYAWLKPAMESAMANSGMGSSIGTLIGFGVIFGALIGTAWPIIVMALMSRPAAKAACAGI
ncbi:MAG: hypothetical protein WKG01_38585 [Kofleriaceae bacterium]